MTIWLISDTHFGHENIIGYCGRPFANAAEMDEAMIERWNATVKPSDKLRTNHGDVEAATARLVECVTFGEWSPERMATLLDIEHPDERDDRRQAFARGEFPTRVSPVPVVYETEAEAGARARAALQALAGWR